MNNEYPTFEFDLSKRTESGFWTRFGVDFHYCVRNGSQGEHRIVLALLEKQPGVLSYFVEEAMQEFTGAADQQNLEITLSCVPLQREGKPPFTPASKVAAMHKLIRRYRQFGFEIDNLDEGDGIELEDIRAELSRSPDCFHVRPVMPMTVGSEL